MNQEETSMLIDVKTIEWQCIGCDHLCKLLTDRLIKPNRIVKCTIGKEIWITEKRGNVMAMGENLKWDQSTMPSQILRQIYDQEQKSKESTLNNKYAVAFALGKALMMEELLNMKPKEE